RRSRPQATAITTGPRPEPDPCGEPCGEGGCVIDDRRGPESFRAVTSRRSAGRRHDIRRTHPGRNRTSPHVRTALPKSGRCAYRTGTTGHPSPTIPRSIVDSHPTRHVLIGDEQDLPLLRAVLASFPPDAVGEVLLELPMARRQRPLPRPVGLAVRILRRGPGQYPGLAACTAPGAWVEEGEVGWEARSGASVPRKRSGGGQDRDRPYRHEHQGEDPMTVVKINRLAVPEGQQDELEKRFAARRHSVDQAPGFEGFELLRPVAGEEHYFVVTRWADDESFRAWAAQRAPRDPAQTVSRAEGILEFEVVELE